MPCAVANPCAAAAEEKEEFPWHYTASAAATATPDYPMCCWQGERRASLSSVSEGGEMGKVGGGAFPLHLQFAANIKRRH